MASLHEPGRSTKICILSEAQEETMKEKEGHGRERPSSRIVDVRVMGWLRVNDAGVASGPGHDA